MSLSAHIQWFTTTTGWGIHILRWPLWAPANTCYTCAYTYKISKRILFQNEHLSSGLSSSHVILSVDQTCIPTTHMFAFRISIILFRQQLLTSRNACSDVKHFLIKGLKGSMKQCVLIIANPVLSPLPLHLRISN